MVLDKVAQVYFQEVNLALKLQSVRETRRQATRRWKEEQWSQCENVLCLLKE